MRAAAYAMPTGQVPGRAVPGGAVPGRGDGERFELRRANPFDAALDAGPADQASGLRRLFGVAARRVVPVAANPFVDGAHALLETLSAALALKGRRVLVVDAASTAPAPHETALFDLVAGVERLDDQVSYLAARGLPLAHVDTHGSAVGFVDAAFDAAPDCDTLLLHADPTDLGRMLVRGGARPVLLGADGAESIKQAYASCKLLVQRAGAMSFDLVLSAWPRTERLGAIAERLASCADNFLGAVVHEAVVVDPVFDPLAAQDAALARLVSRQLTRGAAADVMRLEPRPDSLRAAPFGAARDPF